MLGLALGKIACLAAEDAVATRQILTLEGARKIGEAAAAYARANDANPSIAVVDESGFLLYFVRPESGFAAGANVSIGKAHTAAIFKKPTRDFEEVINKGRYTMTALKDFTPLQGGVPILHEGQVIGAIGVSGAKSAQQDEDVAKAGATAVLNAKVAAK
jgi:glc operon protein GlcG